MREKERERERERERGRERGWFSLAERNVFLNRSKSYAAPCTQKTVYFLSPS